MEEKIVLEFTKESILSKKTNDEIECVCVEIYCDARPDEYIMYRDFKLKIPFSTKSLVDPKSIQRDDFNRYVLNGYCVPNAYSYGVGLLLDKIEERKKGEK